MLVLQTIAADHGPHESFGCWLNFMVVHKKFYGEHMSFDGHPLYGVKGKILHGSRRHGVSLSLVYCIAYFRQRVSIALQRALAGAIHR
ncbi:hypothetical protein Mapa_009370 [Marchantia paleacea]|nr:hypothetical protein Mapa_009370 [Marchantia paleacea]